MKKGYKVVSVSAGLLFSVAIPTPIGSRYIPDKQTFPVEGGGPLCIFESQKDAENFITNCKALVRHKIEVQIWECEYEPSQESHVWPTWCAFGDHFTTLNKLPTGTKLAESVTLTNRVNLEIFSKNSK
jgi:hypothetical protein